MTNPKRCRTLWDQSCQILKANIPGSFVECGVWRGGSAAVMGLANRHLNGTRDLHLFDSFEGLPEPTEKDGALARNYSGGRDSGALKSLKHCEAGLPEVQEFLLGHLRLNKAKVHFHAGWFQDTVPREARHLGPIALLRLDGDWYESTYVCLEHLYPNLSPGGILVLDDYWSWEGCRRAADEYRNAHNITNLIHRIDAGAGFWIKT
jgi:hypothetical protein